MQPRGPSTGHRVNSNQVGVAHKDDEEVRRAGKRAVRPQGFCYLF
jgi:hypothetical protein